MATETATHGADAAHAAEASAGMPQLDFATFPNQIFWLVVSVLVLYLLLSRVALPRIASVLEDRHQTISNDLEKAAQLKRDAEEAEAAYNAALAEARAEAQRIAAEAKAEIQKEVDAATAKADAEIAAKAAESQKRIEEIRDSALAAVEEVAGETATEIVKAIMPNAADDAAIAAAVTQRVKG